MKSSNICFVEGAVKNNADWLHRLLKLSDFYTTPNSPNHILWILLLG
jgi:hypothetical protein